MTAAAIARLERAAVGPAPAAQQTAEQEAVVALVVATRAARPGELAVQAGAVARPARGWAGQVAWAVRRVPAV